MFVIMNEIEFAEVQIPSPNCFQNSEDPLLGREVRRPGRRQSGVLINISPL